MELPADTQASRTDSDLLPAAELLQFPSPRARGMHASDEVSEKSMHAAFESLVGSLRLRGPNRDLCRDAFLASPDGFEACVRSAVERASTSPAGLLVRMVKDGDHLDVTPVEAQKVNRCGCTHAACAYLDVCGELGG